LTVLATLEKRVLSAPPRAVRAAMMATATRPAMRPYSIAVLEDSQEK
jgi:hypothetical protein